MMEMDKALSGKKRLVIGKEDFEKAMDYCRLEPHTRRIAYDYLVNRIPVKETMEKYAVSKVRLFQIRRTVIKGFLKYRDSVDNPGNRFIPMAKPLHLNTDTYPKEMYLIATSINHRITEIVMEQKGVNTGSVQFALAVHTWLVSYFDMSMETAVLVSKKRISNTETKPDKTQENKEQAFNRGWNYMVRLSEALPSLIRQRVQLSMSTSIYQRGMKKDFEKISRISKI